MVRASRIAFLMVLHLSFVGVTQAAEQDRTDCITGNKLGADGSLPRAYTFINPIPPGKDAVFFSEGSARLSNEAKSILDLQVKLVGDMTRVSLNVTGDADSREAPNAEAAALLAYKRADAVREYLIARHIPEDRIFVGRSRYRGIATDERLQRQAVKTDIVVTCQGDLEDADNQYRPNCKIQERPKADDFRPPKVVAYFDEGSARLSDEARQALRELALGLGSRTKIFLDIIGFTDDVEAPDADAARMLGYQRADAMREYLIAQDVPPGRLFIGSRGYGAFSIKDHAPDKLKQLRFALTEFVTTCH